MDGRNTLQKDIILQTLRQMRCHPTAAQVFQQIHADHPAISRSTVYRVLGRMADEGKILRLELGGSDTRYDGELAPHCHVCCRICGQIADLPPVCTPPPAETAGFLLEDCAVVYRGVCPQCRARQA